MPGQRRNNVFGFFMQILPRAYALNIFATTPESTRERIRYDDVMAFRMCE